MSSSCFDHHAGCPAALAWPGWSLVQGPSQPVKGAPPGLSDDTLLECGQKVPDFIRNKQMAVIYYYIRLHISADICLQQSGK